MAGPRDTSSRFLKLDQREQLIKEVSEKASNVLGGGVKKKKKKKKRQRGRPLGSGRNKKTIQKLGVATSSAEQQQQQQKDISNTGSVHDEELEHSSGCLVCGLDDDHARMLLCEGCNGEYHIHCLIPPLDEVPADDWFCDRCKPDAGDGLEQLVLSLPPAYTSRFGEICWAQGGVGYGWWPCCIYDPRLTIGCARFEARKSLGKKHLVYFFQCDEAPFAVLPESKTMTWEMGILEGLYFGRTASSAGRMPQFRQAVQAACIEANKPRERRLDWNHQEQPLLLPSPTKLERTGKKRKRTGKGKKEHGNETKDQGESQVSPSRLSGSRKVARRTIGFGPEQNPASNAPPDDKNEPIVGGVEGSQDTEAVKAKTAVPDDKREPIVGDDGNQDTEAVKDATGRAANDRSTRIQAPGKEAAEPVGKSVEAEKRPVAGAAETRKLDPTSTFADVGSVLFCQIKRKVGDTGEEPLGFLQLRSRTATFADARVAILNELDSVDPGWNWRFYLQPLGPVSLKQESNFGSLLNFLRQNLPGTDFGEGTALNPFRLLLDDAPAMRR